MTRSLLYFLPAVAVTGVAFALLVVARPRAVTAARVYGGPTDGVSGLAWRLQVVEHKDGVERSVHGGNASVIARIGALERTWSGVLDAFGHAEVSVSPIVPTRDALLVRVMEPGEKRPLAAGAVRLGREKWRTGAGRRGGWLPGQAAGTLAVRAAPLHGAFAVPFADELRVEVRRQGQPAQGVSLEVEADGADLQTQALAGKVARLETAADGRATVLVAPREHAVSVSIRARLGGEEGRLDVALPVVPGAMRATAVPGGVRVDSPIARERAYVSFVNDRVRLGGGAVTLQADGRGGATGTLKWTLSSVGPFWAVVSSELDTQSLALVGWPLGDAPSASEPLETFDVRDRLLLDGLPDALARERGRQDHARQVAAILAAITMVLTLVLVGSRVRTSRSDIGHAEEDRPGVSSASVRGLWRIVVAFVLIAVGFLALALFVMLRG